MANRKFTEEVINPERLSTPIFTHTGTRTFRY